MLRLLLGEAAPGSDGSAVWPDVHVMSFAQYRKLAITAPIRIHLAKLVRWLLRGDCLCTPTRARKRTTGSMPSTARGAPSPNPNPELGFDVTQPGLFRPMCSACRKSQPTLFHTFFVSLHSRSRAFVRSFSTLAAMALQKAKREVMEISQEGYVKPSTREEQA